MLLGREIETNAARVRKSGAPKGLSTASDLRFDKLSKVTGWTKAVLLACQVHYHFLRQPLPPPLPPLSLHFRCCPWPTLLPWQLSLSASSSQSSPPKAQQRSQVAPFPASLAKHACSAMNQVSITKSRQQNASGADQSPQTLPILLLPTVSTATASLGSRKPVVGSVDLIPKMR